MLQGGRLPKDEPSRGRRWATGAARRAASLLLVLLPFVLFGITFAWLFLTDPGGLDPQRSELFVLRISLSVFAVAAAFSGWTLHRLWRHHRSEDLHSDGLVTCPSCRARTSPDTGECQWCDEPLRGGA